MPSDDLILNVRQIGSYSPVGNAVSSDALLIQRGGLGGPYLSISPTAFVSTALAQGGDMAVGGQVSAQAFSGGSAQFSNAAVNLFSAQKACIVELAATWGTVGGVPIATANDLAAFRATTVNTFNGRVGDVRLWVQDILSAGGAPNFSPVFGGEPRAPTPASSSHSSRLATTAFVHRNSVEYIDSLLACHPFVFTFNGRTGDVVLTDADITAALAGAAIPYAPLDSPNFTGYATSLTPPPGTATGQIATTAFVMNAVADSTTGVATFNGRTGVVVLAGADITAAGGALLASPALSGTPTAPTAAPGTNTTQLATTAFVMAAGDGSSFAPLNSPAFTGVPTAPTAAVNTSTAQLATTAFVMNEIAAVNAGVTTFNGRTGTVTLLANDVSAAGGATLASPAFTGTPTAPTATAGNSSTQLATTAFVQAAIASGSVASFNGRAGAVTLTTADITGAGGVTGGPYLPLAGGTMTGAITPAQPAGIVGTTAANNAAAGAVGEYIQVDHMTNVTIATATVTTIASISLTAGDWDVDGTGYALCSVAAAYVGFALSPTSNANPGPSSWLGSTALQGAGATIANLATGTIRVSVAATTNYYLVTQVNFTGGTCSAQGSIRARRVR